LGKSKFTILVNNLYEYKMEAFSRGGLRMRKEIKMIVRLR